MLCRRIFFVLGFVLQMSSVYSLWQCSEDVDCGFLSGSVCRNGSCVCPAGQQSVLGGTQCVDAAPYYTSPCIEDHQCSNLVTGFECRKDSVDSVDGNCFCQAGFHYFQGRCWRSIDYGEECTRDEECFGPIRDPFSLSCNGVCQCADGYYERQRGECRMIAYSVEDNCVIDEDCQFPYGACNITSFTCHNLTIGATSSTENYIGTYENVISNSILRQDAMICGTNNTCPSPFVCSAFGACVCPPGYYARENGTECLAHLGSPATESQCVGMFAEVRNRVCSCQANFFYEENMVDCTKVSRRITDTCVTDANCHTFGANARCGDPQEPWGLRNCECNRETSVWDPSRDLCRLFAGIGESCNEDNDCMAGDLEIVCNQTITGEGICVCPSGYVELNGLCLTSGLQLGDFCQASQECTGTPDTLCENNRCSCDVGYQEINGTCSPTIGGVCTTNSDCMIANTVCMGEGNSTTCQCNTNFVTYDDYCWPSVSGYEALCNVTAQCAEVLGEKSVCRENQCVCVENTHYRDGGCWNRIGLFETCTRSSECFLQDMSEQVVCRNSLCQCSFEHPYSEELRTCVSGASTNVSQIFLIVGAILYLFWN